VTRPRFILALCSASLAGCFHNPRPILPSCVVAGRGRNEGTLAVLPSEIPGLSLEGAHWATATSFFEFGFRTTLGVRATMRADRPVPLADVLYVVTFLPGSGLDTTLVATAPFYEFRPDPVPTPNHSGDMVRRDSITPTTPLGVSIGLKEYPSRRPGPWRCPGAVQIRRRQS
jgi:hypothetical protein